MSIQCVIDGCEQKHYGRGWCRTHYRRWWDTGSPLLQPRAVPERRLNNSGYVLLRCPGHPLATSPGGRGLEHRIKVYDAIGPGTHSCHYCDVAVTWGIDLQVDHADSDQTNNDLSNLVVCCGSCNARRANLRRWRGEHEEALEETA